MKLTLPENTKTSFTLKSTLKSGIQRHQLVRQSRGQFAKANGLAKGSAECFRLWQEHTKDYEAAVSHVRTEAKRAGLTDTNLIVKYDPSTGHVVRVENAMTIPKEESATAQAKALADENAQLRAELAKVKGLPAPAPVAEAEVIPTVTEAPAPTTEAAPVA